MCNLQLVKRVKVIRAVRWFRGEFMIMGCNAWPFSRLGLEKYDFLVAFSVELSEISDSFLDGLKSLKII